MKAAGMAEAIQLILGAVLVVTAWLLPRVVARSALSMRPQLALDMAPWFLGAALLMLATGRPIFTGFVVLTLGAGFALADRTMRDALREPIVFCTVSELPQVFTHPHLYLPFAGPRLVVGGALAGVAVAGTLLVFEPPWTSPEPLIALVLLGLLAVGCVLISREPLLGLAARSMRRLRPGEDPDLDAKNLGPFAMLLVHGIVAKGERAARQKAFAAPAVVGERQRHRRGPVIIVQCESFFDARRVTPLVPADLLPAFDACRREAAMHGRLEVPGWGANTMRTEFAVLTGIPDTKLGYDRFNPYFALARAPIVSQAWRLRRHGYRAVCLHPFDRRFFRRDLAMPALGFEKFLGRETLGGSRVPPYYPDPDLAQQVLQVLDAEGPQTFIFVITMENHGPWHEAAPSLDEELSAAFDPESLPQRDQLLRYLDGLRRSDRMLQILAEGLTERGNDGVLAFYGDHLPSFPRAFHYFGFEELHSDYVIWPGHAESPQRVDLLAHQLGNAVVDLVLGDHEGRVDAIAEAMKGATPMPIAALGLD
jgi:hypothetical protein